MIFPNITYIIVTALRSPHLCNSWSILRRNLTFQSICAHTTTAVSGCSARHRFARPQTPPGILPEPLARRAQDPILAHTNGLYFQRECRSESVESYQSEDALRQGWLYSIVVFLLVHHGFWRFSFDRSIHLIKHAGEFPKIPKIALTYSFLGMYYRIATGKELHIKKIKGLLSIFKTQK